MTRKGPVGAKPLFFLALLAGLASCVVPKRVADSPPQRALQATEETPLGCLVSRADPPGTGLSGFEVLDTSRSAYLARLDLVDLAQRSLDLQYYIWADDLTGRLFLDRVARAARRGVRVRILLDDFPGARKDGRLRALVALQPNVEVRLFNPFGSRRLPYLRRWAEFVARFGTLNHRMHNKLLVADGALAVIGGRNIGDPYFGVARKGYNHRDFDLLCAGPIVAGMSENFDAFWNSDLAFPVESLHSLAMGEDRAEEIWAGMERKVEREPLPAYLQRAPLTARERADGLLEGMVWAAGTLICDGPEKVRGDGTGAVLDAIRDLAAEAAREVVVETPYYADLGRKETTEALDAAAAKGVQIRMLVNSLASVDGPWSAVGYLKARRSLLGHGVELFEARPDAASRRVHTDMRDGGMRLVLHSKVAVVDRRLVFTGTMNLDPRSVYENTEAGVRVDSPELAAQVLAAIEPDFAPENCWRVELGSRCGGCPPGTAPDELVWITDSKGEPVVHRHEPDVSVWRQLSRAFFSLFPINGLL